MTRTIRRQTLLSIAAAGLAAVGCEHVRYDPARATRPYPQNLHLTTVTMPDGSTFGEPRSIDIQVFQSARHLEIVNATPRSYGDFDLWVNHQRFVQRVDELRAGQTIRVPIDGFFDERGDGMNPGGIFRTEDPTIVTLVQIQTNDEDPLVGLIAIQE